MLKLKEKFDFASSNKTPHDLERLLSKHRVNCLQMFKKDHAVLMFASQKDLARIKACW